MKRKCCKRNWKCLIKGELASINYLINQMSTKTKIICVLTILGLILLRKFFYFALVEFIGWAIILGIGSGIGFLLMNLKKHLKHR
ncbi:hypothetical protein [Oceanirhabdus sp. W0125-5]|uniref:hypothetical protein n=1 Tax=Oceanirhabdus sp. W0125-5 TaxID=2999116 RepID=UPI0022F32BFD|nr:hypothetical protein [Oceanirhabdus sp. W0125-5]WBW96794.1 hypothetical protein OW730_24345 [Oceanirhabdus sp. W0125-5]